MLKGKKILLGITGGIAAYKSAVITRLLIKEGAEVQVLMTPIAREFITPLTMATLSKKPVLVDFFDPEDGRWNSHIDLGSWADAYIIAPASANTIAKMAGGIADNLLLTTYLSARSAVFIAPAMDLDMYRHAATQANLKKLEERGVRIIDPGTGELASGLEGKGRMAEPEEIVSDLTGYLAKKKNSKLRGRTILVNAGPTHEKLDPVRYISNHSSGKMGLAIAGEAHLRGAKVVLVLGPVSDRPDHRGIDIINVVSASEMADQTIKYFKDCDIAILTAAVADYTPVSVSDGKIKKENEDLTIRLKPTIDIAAKLGSMKRESQLLAGFALETDNEKVNAISKLERKNLDLIILNSLRDRGAGFKYDTNRVTMIDKDNNIDNFELKSKKEVAVDILNKIETIL